ncbi:serine/threonine protein kinase [Rhodococcus sp. IEGM 1318]|uniref:serine/threonine protein kinase n=1 Tax=Rhodococcus sp. IEGM 1318 TaxID=3082226 RepID=UPI00295362B3|nr:serine/threonine protein kinase [Rhodococcus sp. IEGM 1318]MDV8003310.1 serine/threonine protein kinase [Rhodococcus sp. IEGM 1318]
MPDNYQQPPNNQAWSQSGPQPPQLGYRAAPQSYPPPQGFPPGPPRGNPPPRRPGWVIPVSIIGVITVLALFGGLAWVLWPKDVPNSTAGGAAHTTTAANRPGTTGATTTAPSTTSPTTTRAANFPAGASACPGGQPAGSYKESATSGGKTSCEFAEAVRIAYGNSGAAGRSSTVSARSPVTGKEYTMACKVASGIVTCTGGDNAVVYLR